MNLFWFSDEDGHFWSVIAAKTEESAWQRLAESLSTNPGSPTTVEGAREKFGLNAVTEIDCKTEGEVAVSWPLECNFSIKKKPGGELSMLRNY